MLPAPPLMDSWVIPGLFSFRPQGLSSTGRVLARHAHSRLSRLHPPFTFVSGPPSGSFQGSGAGQTRFRPGVSLALSWSGSRSSANRVPMPRGQLCNWVTDQWAWHTVSAWETASGSPGTCSRPPVLSPPMPLEHLLSPRTGRWTRLPAPEALVLTLISSWGWQGRFALTPKPQPALREGFAREDFEPAASKRWGEGGGEGKKEPAGGVPWLSRGWLGRAV